MLICYRYNLKNYFNFDLESIIRTLQLENIRNYTSSNIFNDLRNAPITTTSRRHCDTLHTFNNACAPSHRNSNNQINVNYLHFLCCRFDCSCSSCGQYRRIKRQLLYERFPTLKTFHLRVLGGRRHEFVLVPWFSLFVGWSMPITSHRCSDYVYSFNPVFKIGTCVDKWNNCLF